MSYSITAVEGEPIFIATLNRDFDFATELQQLIDDIDARLDQVTNKVVMIDDIQNVSLDLDAILQAANVARRRDSSMFHPNIGGVVVVSASTLIQLSAKGLNTATFGNLTLPVVGTRDEALNYARQLIRQWEET